MSRQTLGRWGEEFVAKVWGYTRHAASGARWPWKEDLTGRDAVGKVLAQVKTTASVTMARALQALLDHAEVEQARAKWYYVVKRPGKVYVIEGFVYVFDTTVGGDI